MQNVRGVPQGRNNLAKEDRIKECVEIHKPDLYAVLETGIHEDKKPAIPLRFNKVLHNNVTEQEITYHKTPLGAGTLCWANERITL